ncbi:MAG: hypothetical protein U9N58_01245 [Thermodesulfobacteriota bacterium]|nr:hypothetical protein [Thermodesulfobacteriota bacterium]
MKREHLRLPGLRSSTRGADDHSVRVVGKILLTSPPPATSTLCLKKGVTYHLSRSAVADCGEGSVYPGKDDRSGTIACLDSRGNGRPRFAG